jgi:hypothetical protein
MADFKTRCHFVNADGQMQLIEYSISDNTSSSAAITGASSNTCHPCYAAIFYLLRPYIPPSKRQRTPSKEAAAHSPMNREMQLVPTQ